MISDDTFGGTVVLVTGGSRGIGRAVAERFAAAGATVVVQFREQRAAADEVVAALPPGGHLALQADVSDPEQVRVLVQDVVDRLGRIDVLVNNAGIYVTAVAPGFVETDMAEDYLNGPGGEAVRTQSPLLRPATPDEVARVVVFLATPGAESTTGTIVDVNGASYLRS